MRSFFGIVIVGWLAGIGLMASPSEHLNFGSQINAAQCNAGGKLVINISQHITQDADSGFAGAWAFDDNHRTIQVWQTGTNTFCAVVKYQGSFTTIAGPSPQNTGTVGAGVTGTFEGGYQSTVFTGTLNPNPAYKTRGNIGDFNYACDTNFNCPGYVDWTAVYFTSTSGFDLAWWGWVYHGGNNGSWVNAISGSSGDITGN